MDYIGFYWTLPVPWAGFTELPQDPDAAAKVSRTIRYQVERVRRWVAEEKGRLIHEEVFLELAPDRGSEEIVPVIDKVIAQAHAEGACLVLVDFSLAMQWRRHGPLWDRLNQSGIVEALDPEPMQLAEETLDPIAHFRTWRRLQDAYSSAKDKRREAVAEVIGDLRAEGMTYAKIARELNGAEMMTPNGKPWTGENVRKAVSD